MMHDPYTRGRPSLALGYDYTPASLMYRADPGWNGWELANAQYGASGRGMLERDWFDGVIDRMSSYFSTKRLTEPQARDAHMRIYHHADHAYDRLTSHALGGAAAYEVFLIWDRDLQGIYDGLSRRENRSRLVALAVGEVYALWDRLGIHPNPARGLSLQDAAETAAATAKHLFDHHYKRHHHEESSRRRRHSISSGSEYMTGTSHHSKGSHHHHHRRTPSHHSHQRSHSHARSHHASRYGQHHRQLSDLAMAASLEHARERDGAYAPQLAGPGMYAGMRGVGTGHPPPGLGGGPVGLSGMPPGMPGMSPIGAAGMGMGMNPGMMNMGMGGMNPMMQGMISPHMMQMSPRFGGGGAMAHPVHSTAMYHGADAGQMMENQMMASHQAMHGQAIPASRLLSSAMRR
ncbi:hypothetical protein NliqN6_6646 [Naganishia liquefaciens]|uniref:Uncharacterized protein n=1 Tax=Naganishia liquefaciens TaxID=104408 RepID=A0A8H3U1T2_9TREE|nr:hypothetical protein NliqN6_6646 [Naganishia liquefaciens]